MCNILTLNSCSSFVKVDRLDLSIPNRIIDDIIQNPDTLVFYHMQDNFTNRTYDEMKKLKAKTISILKTEYDGEYRFTYSFLYRAIPSFKEKISTSDNRSSESHKYEITMNSLKSGRNLTFKFYCKNGSWILRDLTPLKPLEYPTVHRNPFDDEKRISDLNETDNCKPFIDDNYNQIKKLLLKKDSLYFLLKGVIHPSKYKDEILSSETEFYELAGFFSGELFSQLDIISEAPDSLKSKGITMLNKIWIESPENKILVFYFLKKNGVWQFYDIPSDNDLNMP